MSKKIESTARGSNTPAAAGCADRPGTEQGRAISVQDIADRATLNRATFYLHYGDKTDLLMDTFETLVAGAQPLPPEEAAFSRAGAGFHRRVFQHRRSRRFLPRHAGRGERSRIQRQGALTSKKWA
jgi:AcrR family transcriptional regulator